MIYPFTRRDLSRIRASFIKHHHRPTFKARLVWTMMICSSRCRKSARLLSLPESGIWIRLVSRCAVGQLYTSGTLFQMDVYFVHSSILHSRSTIASSSSRDQRKLQIQNPPAVLAYYSVEDLPARCPLMQGIERDYRDDWPIRTSSTRSPFCARATLSTSTVS